jgi:hypothetical protein
MTRASGVVATLPEAITEARAAGSDKLRPQPQGPRGSTKGRPVSGTEPR